MSAVERKPAKPRRVFRLSEQEAMVLQNILNSVGGHPTKHLPRGVADTINTRLYRTFGYLGNLPRHGTIYF